MPSSEHYVARQEELEEEVLNESIRNEHQMSSKRINGMAPAKQLANERRHVTWSDHHAATAADTGTSHGSNSDVEGMGRATPSLHSSADHVDVRRSGDFTGKLRRLLTRRGKRKKQADSPTGNAVKARCFPCSVNN